MENCIFCKIIKGEIPCAKVYEDEKVLAFLDINPVNYGHTLVIPKEHYQWMTDAPDEVIPHIFIKAKELMQKIKTVLKADYVALTIIGVDVSHFHLHIIPRYFNDGLRIHNCPTKKYKEGEIEKIAKKISE